MQRAKVEPGCQRASATGRDQDMGEGEAPPGPRNASKSHLSWADCSDHLVQGKLFNYLKFSQGEKNCLRSPI